MARELFQSGNGYLPSAYVNNTSQQRNFTGTLDPSTLGYTIAVGDKWFDAGTAPTSSPAPTGWGPYILNEQFASIDPTKWNVYNNSTFGAPSRIQRYMSYNAVPGAGSAGSTNGTSLRMISKREVVGTNNFTAAMLDTQSVSVYYPRYLRVETRMKIPHGQGLWPAFWLTAHNGGSTMVEVDFMEYFHSQVPGMVTSTLHRTNASGTYQSNVSKHSMFFENPTYTPGWHTYRCEITPSAGGDPTQPSASVDFKTFIDDVAWWSYTDTSAIYWTTNGGSENAFYNIYLQGCQIDGNYVGHPDDPLGYSAELNACLIGGTPPNSCTITSGGRSIIRAGAPGSTATFADPACTLEIDYIKISKWLG